MGHFTAIITGANFVAGLVLLLHLAKAKLAPQYTFLFLYLSIDAIGSAAGIFIPLYSDLYAHVYMTTQAAGMAAAAAVVLEMCKLSLKSHPALSMFSRQMAAYVVAFSLVIAGMTIFLEDGMNVGQSAILHRFFAVERILDFALVVFLLCMSAFLAWFPVMVKRNVIVYVAGFSVYFLSRSFILLAANRLPAASIQGLSNLLLCISLACLVWWIWKLRPEGEAILTVTGHRWNPEAFEHLARQLDSIDGAVGRLGRP